MPATRTSDNFHFKRSSVGASNRKHNTACAACRKRRVRCDRRDGDVEVCTECAQRGFHCVDDENKATKILRRGRKIQELESIYGQYPPGGRPIQSAAASSSAVKRPPGTASTAPKSKPTPADPPSRRTPKTLGKAFLTSEFYKRLHLQFPILDPADFTERYNKYLTKGVPLGPCGELIAQTLRAWAISFGFDENGRDSIIDDREADAGTGFEYNELISVNGRKNVTDALVKDILASIDANSVVRTTSWDGVLVLLLLLPLTGGILSDADRANLYHSTLFHVYALSGVGFNHDSGISPGGPVNEIVRARVFWYAHVAEGITSALNGTKLIFDQDDVSSFKTSLTSSSYNVSLSKSPITSSFTYHFTFAPIRLAAACRLIFDCLTGPKAQRLALSGQGEAPSESLEEVWTALEASWDEFERLKNAPSQQTPHDGGDDGGVQETTDIFVTGWQIFIYEIHNIIREKLWSRISSNRQSLSSERVLGAGMNEPDFNSSSGSLGTNTQHTKAHLRDLISLHDTAEAKCNTLAPRVVKLIEEHVDSSLFSLDAAFVEKGVVFAAEYLANDADADDDFQTCLSALSRSRWAYSKAEDRIQKLNALWDSRRSAAVRRNYPSARRSSTNPLLSGAMGSLEVPPFNESFRDFPAPEDPIASSSLTSIDISAFQLGVGGSSVEGSGAKSYGPPVAGEWKFHPTTPTSLKMHSSPSSVTTTPRRSASIPTETNSQSTSPALSQTSQLAPDHPMTGGILGGNGATMPSGTHSIYDQLLAMAPCGMDSRIDIPHATGTTVTSPVTVAQVLNQVQQNGNSSSGQPRTPSTDTGIASYSGPSTAVGSSSGGLYNSASIFNEVNPGMKYDQSSDTFYRSSLGLSTTSFSPSSKYGVSVEFLEYMRASSLLQTLGSNPGPNPAAQTSALYFSM